jgi:hypothetical protein
MRLKNTNWRNGRNLGIVRDVLAGFPEEDVISLEHIGGLNHLVWREGMERHFESLSVPIPSAWLDEPGFETKLMATSKSFVGWVLKAKNDRRNESSRRSMVEK